MSSKPSSNSNSSSYTSTGSDYSYENNKTKYWILIAVIFLIIVLVVVWFGLIASGVVQPICTCNTGDSSSNDNSDDNQHEGRI